jgi:hypothetical protein
MACCRLPKGAWEKQEKLDDLGDDIFQGLSTVEKEATNVDGIGGMVFPDTSQGGQGNLMFNNTEVVISSRNKPQGPLGLRKR